MIIIFLILGLAVGSFLNVLVFRLRLAEKIFLSRSKCPHCQKNIRWFDNIPVLSFVFLKTRCRDCRGKISWQYPLVEIGTGLIFAAIGWKFFSLENSETWLLTLFYLFASSSLITILVYDFLYLEIPSEALWISIFLALIFALYFDGISLLNSEANPIDLLDSMVYSGILAAVVAFMFFFTLSFFSGEKYMGMGDTYLVVFIGLVLGWPETVLALFLAFTIGAAYGIMAIVLKKKKMKSRVPFTPFLAAGTLITLFFYAPIVDWYIALF